MKMRRQRKLYPCTRCAGFFLHDAMYRHVTFECSLRPPTNAQLLQRFLMDGKVYHPMAERDR